MRCALLRRVDDPALEQDRAGRIVAKLGGELEARQVEVRVTALAGARQDRAERVDV